MEVTKVTSSNIDAIGYDPMQRVLKVVFKSGSIYDYYEVGQEVYDDLMSAESIGRTFNQTVRNVFMFKKVGQI